MRLKPYKQKDLMELYGLRARYIRSDFDSNGVLLGSYAKIQRAGKDGVIRDLKPQKNKRGVGSTFIEFSNGRQKVLLSFLRALYCLCVGDLTEDELVIRIDPTKDITDFNNLKKITVDEHMQNVRRSKRRK